MRLTQDQAAAAVEALACPTCAAPAGSPCLTRGGMTASRYHTARFVLVPALSGEPEVLVPRDRSPGSVWRVVARAGPAAVVAPVRIGYAWAGPAPAELAAQVAALAGARCDWIFAERGAATAHERPELRNALALAGRIRQANPGQPVIVTVRELKWLARDAAELIATAGELRSAGLRLTVITGPLAGDYDPHGAGSLMFEVLAAAGGLNRARRRQRILAGQQAATAGGRPGGRPKVFDEHMLAAALTLRDQGLPVPEIAGRLRIATGKNAGQHPSLASVYRALAAADAGETAAETDEAAGSGETADSRDCERGNAR